MMLRCIFPIMALMLDVGSVKSMAKSSIMAIFLILLSKHLLLQRISRHTSIRCMVWHKKFADLLNVVVIVKTNLKTQAVAHVVLFSSDLDLPYDQLIDYYRVRFQLEFNFRDAKQYWGLEDFMTVKQTPVYNSANLAMFMVNLSHAVMRPLQPQWPGLSVNDLKAWFRSRKYVIETLKVLPEMPEPIFMDQAIAQVAALGRVNQVVNPI
jgi:putative transposase